jgi:hypothetical protein
VLAEFPAAVTGRCRSWSQRPAAYAENELTRLGQELGRDLYSLSTDTFQSDQSLDYAHLFVMPEVAKELIDRFIDDLRKPRLSMRRRNQPSVQRYLQSRSAPAPVRRGSPRRSPPRQSRWSAAAFISAASAIAAPYARVCAAKMATLPSVARSDRSGYG